MKNNILLYQTPDDGIKLDVFLKDETLWLSQKRIAELFGVQRPAITKHLKNIFESGELDEEVVSSILEHTTKHGAIKDKIQIKSVKVYNLDAIIAVGYRVNSKKATLFRIWATEVLKKYIVEGFVLNDERFKTGKSVNYFAKLQDRIREIRLSERFFYQKIKDIYTTSIDYDSKNEKTILFFKIIQNKLIWAISEQTAAELIHRRVDAELPLMGMQSLDKKNTQRVVKKDISISKNYLNEKEMKLLGLLVEQYLAFAETMAQQKNPMYMKDWIAKLDNILQINGRKLLDHAGEISRQQMLKKTVAEYKKYKKEQQKIEKELSLKELEADIKRLKSEVKVK